MGNKRKNTMKRLKLRISKFDRMLVVEQMELEGNFERTKHTQIYGDLFLFQDHIDFCEHNYNKTSNFREFRDNNERDEYATNLIKWITEEQFGDAGELEVGKECLVSNDEGDWYWHKRIFAGRIAKQLDLEKRFLTLPTSGDETFECWKYAKPNNCLDINGEIYTWKVEQ